MEKTFKFIDLFAGIGGMRIAFEQAQMACVLTCEINPDALVTYRHNFQPNCPSGHVYSDNILTLQNHDIPEFDILVGGFPCQPYSIAGMRKGLHDERGGDIFLAILRILKAKQLQAFLLENVKGIQSHDKGETFKFMLESLQNCGYHVRFSVLNSMEHAGIPQNRERMFIAGFTSKNACKNFTFPQKMPLTQTIHDCFEKQKVADEFYYNERYKCNDDIQKSVTCKNTIYQWRRQYVRENKSSACPTLTANMGTGGHNVPLIKDDWGVRKLTPRETANFQGFPPDFILPKSLSCNKLYQQFGNSVTVPLIAKLACEMNRVLQKEHSDFLNFRAECNDLDKLALAC